MFKILGAKNRRKNLHKHPGPPFQIRGGPVPCLIFHNVLTFKSVEVNEALLLKLNFELDNSTFASVLKSFIDSSIYIYATPHSN